MSEVRLALNRNQSFFLKTTLNLNHGKIKISLIFDHAIARVMNLTKEQASTLL
jgi:hypothetical protein